MASPELRRGYPSEIWWRSPEACVAVTVWEWEARWGRGVPLGVEVALDVEHPYRMRTVRVYALDVS